MFLFHKRAYGLHQPKEPLTIIVCAQEEYHPNKCPDFDKRGFTKAEKIDFLLDLRDKIFDEEVTSVSLPIFFCEMEFDPIYDQIITINCF